MSRGNASVDSLRVKGNTLLNTNLTFRTNLSFCHIFMDQGQVLYAVISRPQPSNGIIDFFAGHPWWLSITRMQPWQRRVSQCHLPLTEVLFYGNRKSLAVRPNEYLSFVQKLAWAQTTISWAGTLRNGPWQSCSKPKIFLEKLECFGSRIRNRWLWTAPAKCTQSPDDV